MGSVYLKTPNNEGIYNTQDKVLLKPIEQTIIYDIVGSHDVNIDVIDITQGITFECWGPGTKGINATTTPSASDGGYGGNYMKSYYSGGTYTQFDINVGDGQLIYSQQGQSFVRPDGSLSSLCLAQSGFHNIGAIVYEVSVLNEYRGGSRGTATNDFYSDDYYGAGAGGGGAGENGTGGAGDNGDPFGGVAYGGTGADSNDGADAPDSTRNPSGSDGNVGTSPGGGGSGAYKSSGINKIGGNGGNGKVKITYYI